MDATYLFFMAGMVTGIVGLIVVIKLAVLLPDGPGVGDGTLIITPGRVPPADPRLYGKCDACGCLFLRPRSRCISTGSDVWPTRYSTKCPTEGCTGYPSMSEDDPRKPILPPRGGSACPPRPKET